MASSQERVLLFPKYVCSINTIIKGKPSVSDGGVEARAGAAAFLAMASRAQPNPAVSVEEERPCIPSCCQAAQNLLSANFAWLKQLREGDGRRRQQGSYAKLLPLPGSKALLDSEK